MTAHHLISCPRSHSSPLIPTFSRFRSYTSDSSASNFDSDLCSGALSCSRVAKSTKERSAQMYGQDSGRDPILPTICEENPPALARPPAFLRALLCKAQDSSCNNSPTQTTANHRQTRLPSDHRSKQPHRSQSHGLVLQQNSEGCCTSPRRMLTLHTPQFSRRYRGPPPPNRSPFAALRA
jgi:hypothetical protein